MNLFEKIAYAYQHNEPVPLKGHMRFILEDVRDGTQQVEEVDNIITNALGSILNHNYNGNARFDSLMPMRKLLGGVFLFENQQTVNADNFNPPSELVNPLIAHAGDAANNTGSTLRGSPVVNDFVITDTSIKQVWLWDNTQGNGQYGTGHIESVSLVPALLGNMGLKPFNAEFNPLSTFGGTSVVNNVFNEDTAKQFPFNISDNGKTSVSLWLDGATFKEYNMRHDFFAFGIMRDANTWQTVNTRTATVRTGSNRFVFDDADYYYIARASSATALQIDKVSKSTFAVTQADASFSGVSLFTGNLSGVNTGSRRIFAYDGTYLYYPNAAGNGFYKLNISDTTDFKALDGTITINKGQLSATGNGKQYASPLVINNGLILGDNYIINGDNVYQIAQCHNIGLQTVYTASGSYLWLVRQGAACYGHSKQTYSTDADRATGQMNTLCNMFLSSIVNLPQAREKTASQTMRVEYTVSEQV